MRMLYRKCWKCGQVKEVFPYSKECRKCYQQGYYHERKVKLAAVDPATASGYITGTLKGVELLMDCGLLSHLRGAAMQEELLGLHEKLQAQIDSNEETQALIDAQIEEAQEVVKQALSEGAIEAESLEEAQQIVAATDAERERARQERERAELDAKTLAEGNRRKFAALGASRRERQAVASKKNPFVTGEKKDEDAA
jgi:hypothetical protein